MKSRTATIDTNLADRDEVIEAAERHGVHVVLTSVSDRELEGSSISPRSSGRILEAFVLDESRLGQAVLGSEEDPGTLERILSIISNGSFPPLGSRQFLSEGERRQLRDAMLLHAHARERRDLFITNDERAFLRHGRRAELERLLGTRILTGAEFIQFCQTLLSA